MAAFNADDFTYLRPSDSLLFAKPVLGNNSSDCSERSKAIGNQGIRFKMYSLFFHMKVKKKEIHPG